MAVLYSPNIPTFVFMPTCCTFVFHQLEQQDKPPCFLCLRLMYPCWQSQNWPPVPWCVNLVLKEKKPQEVTETHGNSCCISRVIFFMPAEHQMCTGMCKCESVGKNVTHWAAVYPALIWQITQKPLMLIKQLSRILVLGRNTRQHSNKQMVCYYGRTVLTRSSELVCKQ